MAYLISLQEDTGHPQGHPGSALEEVLAEPSSNRVLLIQLSLYPCLPVPMPTEGRGRRKAVSPWDLPSQSGELGFSKFSTKQQ